MKRLAVLCLVALGWSCTGQPAARNVTDLHLAELVRSRGVVAPAIVVPYRLSGEMRRWAHERVPSVLGSDQERLLYLTQALFDPKDFGLIYDNRHTGTAIEVFDTRRANCLAFTHLFVGMAREVSADVFFLEVRDVETYSRQGDLIVVSDHVAVGYGPDHAIKVIDFGVSPGEQQYRRVSRISDYRAIAMYYSNRGAEFLREGDAATAQGWLRTAVAIDPGYAASWVNLGVSFRRTGNLDAAEAAYHRALEVDLRSGSALQNLAALMNFRGEAEEALDLLALSDTSENRNPFTYLSLGDLSMHHGRTEAAGRYYRKALRRRDENAEPLAAMGLWALSQGDHRKAQRLLRKAEEIDASSKRVSLLRFRLTGAQT